MHFISNLSCKTLVAAHLMSTLVTNCQKMKSMIDPRKLTYSCAHSLYFGQILAHAYITMTNFICDRSSCTSETYELQVGYSPIWKLYVKLPDVKFTKEQLNIIEPRKGLSIHFVIFAPALCPILNYYIQNLLMVW